MSKRGAQGPDGSKETEHAFLMSSTPDDKPQRATAAQLAQRKIKDIRKRPRAATPTSDTFSSISPAPAFSSSGFSAPSNQSGGFTFGQSQSFPGASSGSSQSAPGGAAPFSFGGNGQTSFNFSASTQSTNPFASNSFNANNATPSQPAPSTGFSFGGFGTQSTSQQPTFTFGASQSASATTNNGLFGAPSSAADTAADSMQTSPDAKPTTTSLTPSTSFQNRNIFGGSGASNNLFAPKPATPSSNPFGGLSIPSTTEKPPSDKAEGFAAQPALSQTPVSSSPAQPFGSLFGTTPAAPDPQKTNLPQATPSTPAKPFANLFGGAPATLKPAESEKASSTQAPISTPAKPLGSLFGAAPAPSPAISSAETDKTSTTQTAVNNIFAPTPTGASTVPSNPFMSKSSDQTPSTNLFASKGSLEQKAPATTQKPFGSLFGPSSGSATSNMFSPKPVDEQPPPDNSFSSKPITTGINEASPAPTEEAPLSNLFAPKSATTQPADAAKPAFSGFSAPKTNTGDPTSSNNPFSFKPTVTQPDATSKPLFSSSPAPKPASEQTSLGSLFAPKSTTNETPIQSPKPATSNIFTPKTTATHNIEKAQPFGSLFGAPSTTTPTPASANVQSTPAKAHDMFASKQLNEETSITPVKPALNQSSANLFGAQPTVADFKPAQTPKTALSSSNLHEKITKTIPIPDLPSTLSAEDKVKAELRWRLQTLDMCFQREISKCQPGIHSFDKTVLFYLKVREALGAPVKSDEETRGKSASQVPLMTPSSRNCRPEEPANGDDVNGSATSSIFAKSFSTSSPAAAKTIHSENTFAKSLSGVNGTASKETVTSKGPAPSTFTPVTSTSAGNMFAKSTNSQVSPSPLSIPKFGNGASGVDFMAQFAKKAEKSVAEEKAKRKAEDFDSEEDDEEEWERRDAEKQREKRAKFEANAQKKAVWVEGEGFKFIDAAETVPPKPAEKPAAASTIQSFEKSPLPGASPVPSTSSIFDSTSRPLPNSENIFGRLSATPQVTEDSKDSDESDGEGKSSPHKRAAEDNSDNGAFESDLHKSKRSKPDESAETTKSSLDTPLPAPSAASGRSLFDRVQSTTPQPESKPPNPFAAALSKAPVFPGASGASTPSDQTWNPASPIKFSSTPASAQATGPSATETTSTDATTDEEGAPGAIFDLSQGNAGEEEEKVVFECRARAFKLASAWASQGTGIVRLLQHPESGRARVVLRADPSGHVILNTLLKKEFEYARTSNSVQFMVPQADAAPEHWAIRVKSESVNGFHEKIEEIKN